MLFGRRKRRIPNWIPAGRVLHVRSHEAGVELTCENGRVDLSWLSPACLQVRFQARSILTAPIDWHNASQPTAPVAWELIEGPQALELRTSTLLCRVGKEPFRLDLENLDNRILCMDRGGLLFNADGRVRLSMNLFPSEQGYGLRFRGSAPLNGQRVVLESNLPTPPDPRGHLYVGIHPVGAYGVLWKTPGDAWVDVGMTQPEDLVFEGTANGAEYLLFAGADLVSMFAAYSLVAAKPELPALSDLSVYAQSSPDDVPVTSPRRQSVSVGDPLSLPSVWPSLQSGIGTALHASLSYHSTFQLVDWSKFDDKELAVRWLQAVCLLPYASPVLRPLTVLGQPYDAILRLTLQLRRQLLPYLYSLLAASREYGAPPIRPTIPDEAGHQVSNSFLLGNSVLVAPVIAPQQAQRRLFLPPGLWYDYWTNEAFAGGRTMTVMAPLERLPLFVRSGSVLPLFSEDLDADSPAASSLVYRVYPGEGENLIYEDDGESRAYLDGDYRWVFVGCGWDGARLIINRRLAGRYTPTRTLTRVEVIGLDYEPESVWVDRQGAPLWFYDGGVLEIITDDFQRIEILRGALPDDRTIAKRPK
ncbi:MAG: DUF4968 domain-containing protein [Anaerolineae bacterium]|nr:DUF4968 domain-containing protein [Anaerolineae bacterium]